MKLRLHANSLRVRLSQSEVARFVTEGRIEDTLDFGDGSILSYALESRRDADTPRAALRGSRICIELPWEAARAWAQGDQTGIESDPETGSGASLSILVEKDFQCLHVAPGAASDAFPNPLANTNSELGEDQPGTASSRVS